MTNTQQIEQALKEQLQLLSERSKETSDPIALSKLTETMCAVVRILSEL